ncbi:MAG: metallophosphoesterase [Verrucomicrobiae bacterium]|nr:metallophosphoesterase [Verrucomicrobiae bacterium]
MSLETNRRKFLTLLSSTLFWFVTPAMAQQNPNPNQPRPRGPGGGRRRSADDYVLPKELSAFNWLSLVLGRVSDRSVTVSSLALETIEGFFEHGTVPGHYTEKTALLTLVAGKPVETIFNQLQPNTEYFYRLNYRKPGEVNFQTRSECRFHTQRALSSTFTFAIQGDSHPERPQMSDPDLYARTLLNAAADRPDFYICMGDDFSVAPVHEVNFESVAQRYTLQRPFLGLVAQSAPVFLLNGNHEQASLFNFNQADERHAVAIHAQNARNQFYPTPAPDAFYSGDREPMKAIGLPRDYCAWTWGDALCVILDNYWHSPAQVDSGFHEEEAGGNRGRGKDRDWWSLTLGDAQYQWFKRTLEQSKAKYKFVFAHHVMGSGRGGVDQCDLYEWGGRNRRDAWEFAQRRPGWELPVHQLMVKHGVTIFFQGHDHLFCRQERDGIIYQAVPMPADQGYFAYNADRYQSGVKLPNSGHLRVTVAPEGVKVDYVRSYLPKDETAQNKTGDIAHSYTVKAKGLHA